MGAELCFPFTSVMYGSKQGCWSISQTGWYSHDSTLFWHVHTPATQQSKHIAWQPWQPCLQPELIWSFLFFSTFPRHCPESAAALSDDAWRNHGRKWQALKIPLHSWHGECCSFVFAGWGSSRVSLLCGLNHADECRGVLAGNWMATKGKDKNKWCWIATTDRQNWTAVLPFLYDCYNLIHRGTCTSSGRLKVCVGWSLHRN